MKVVISDDVKFYSDDKLTKSKLKPNPATGEISALRPGTAVAILGRSGRALKIAIISGGRFDLADAENEIGYVEAGAKIGMDVPMELLRKVDVRDIVF